MATIGQLKGTLATHRGLPRGRGEREGRQRKEGDESRILEGLKKGKGGTGRNSEEVGGKEMGRKEREEGGKRLESI